jgi:hypothetical protein
MDKFLANPKQRTEWSPAKRMRNILNAVKTLCLSDHTRIISHYKSVFNFLTGEKLKLAEKYYPTISEKYKTINTTVKTSIKIPHDLAEKYKVNSTEIETFL